MTKTELIEKIAASTGLTAKASGEALNAVLDTIKATLKKGQKVGLVGFGTFSVTKRKARKGRNPQTGASIKIAATKAPKFTAGKGLKDAVK